MSDLFFLKFNPSWKELGEGPLYRKLYQQIRELVLEGELGSGLRLPASRVMAKEFSVSRNTITQAIDGLLADGFLISKQGAGVFVNDQIQFDPIGHVKKNGSKRGVAPEISERAKRLQGIYGEKNHVKNEKPFAPGRPALEEFPFDIWARLLSRRWRMNGAHLAMQEGPAGYRPLREHVSNHLRETRGVHCTADQVLIVSGAQQGLDLMGRVLWENGDQVVVEDPGFPGVEGVIKAAGALPLPIAVDEEGLNVPSSKDLEMVKSFLVTPSRNYPIGVSMSLSRRLALLELARETGAWIVEDDFDCDFRFDGRPLSSLQGLDQDNRVIYIGTFSRILFPALRLGFVVLPEQLIEPFHAVKAYVDGHASIVHQAALADFFEEGYFNSHLRRMRKLYSERRGYLISELEYRFSDFLKIMPSDGGLHLCVEFLQGINDLQIVEILAKEGVVARPLSRFYRLGVKKQGLVLGFAGYSKEEMQKSLRILEKILRE